MSQGLGRGKLSVSSGVCRGGVGAGAQKQLPGKSDGKRTVSTGDPRTVSEGAHSRSTCVLWCGPQRGAPKIEVSAQAWGDR